MLTAILVLQLSAFSPLGAIPTLSPTERTFYAKPIAASLDNQCGRTGPAYLAPVANTHKFPDYPQSAVHRGEEGASQVAVIADKDGNAGDVRMAKSSGYADLDDAAIAAVKKFRWAVPPRECREMGVAQTVNVDWDMGVPTIAIAFDNADYPAAAKPRNLAGVGAVLITQTGDTVTAVKMAASTGSPDLDQAMMDFAKRDITLPSLVRDGHDLTTTMQFLVRFNADPARPVVLLPANLPLTVMDDPA
jgi:TonB family protein